jgi:hypothetical protein
MALWAFAFSVLTEPCYNAHLHVLTELFLLVNLCSDTLSDQKHILCLNKKFLCLPFSSKTIHTEKRVSTSYPHMPGLFHICVIRGTPEPRLRCHLFRSTPPLSPMYPSASPTTACFHNVHSLLRYDTFIFSLHSNTVEMKG